MATQNDSEVKEPTEGDDLDEVLTLDDLEDPDSKDLGDAIVTDPENAPEEEEKETPEESSTEQKPADDEEPEPEKTGEGEEEGEEPATAGTEDDSDPKPVEGETPREKALRQETTRVKRLLRQERGKKMFKDTPVSEEPGELTDEEQAVIDSFDPEAVANMEKLISIQAKKMGFVKKDEFTKEQTVSQLQDSLDTWLDSHPELDEKNDPDGILWKQVQTEYSRYVPPKNAKDLVKILDRAHKEIFGVTTDQQPLKKVDAQKQKIKVASHGASSSSGSPKKSEVEVDEETKGLVASGALKGFSDEDLKEMGLK